MHTTPHRRNGSLSPYCTVGLGGTASYAAGIWEMLMVPADPAGNVLADTGEIGKKNERPTIRTPTMQTSLCSSSFIRTVMACLLALSFADDLRAVETVGPECWKDAIMAFEAADRANPPAQGAILFIGSSTIAGWKTLREDFPDHPVINRGFGGSHISDSVFYADRIVIPYRPRLIVLRAGANDINAGKTPEQVAADFEAFVDKVRSKLPDVRIAYMPINATPARWANVEWESKANLLVKERISAGKNLDYIDTWSATLDADGAPRKDLFVQDGIHFNEQGYQILADIVRKHLCVPAVAEPEHRGP